MKVFRLFAALIMSAGVSVAHADFVVEANDVVRLNGGPCVKMFEGVNYPQKQLVTTVSCGTRPIEGYVTSKRSRDVCVALTAQECLNNPKRIVKTTESGVQLKIPGNPFISIIQVMQKK